MEENDLPKRSRINKKDTQQKNRLNRFPDFTFGKHFYIEGRIIVVDEPLQRETQEKWSELSSKNHTPTHFFHDNYLALKLEHFLKTLSHISLNETLAIFPEYSSIYPKKKSHFCGKLLSVHIPVTRTRIGSKVVCTVGEIPSEFISPELKTILVIDDVICSGTTLQALYDTNSKLIPEVSWVGACWLSQVPRTKYLSGIKGYSHVYAACVVERLNGDLVPTNSLSTLRKNRAIAESYATKHFENPQELLALLGHTTKAPVNEILVAEGV